MAYVYTFPEQETLGGTLGFEVTTLQGSGSTTLTDKYFSDSLRLTKQIELRGGELASSTVEFVIDNDVNNLFQDTIFPTLSEYSSTVGDNNVVVRLSLDSVTKFIGIIVPESIQVEYYYATNDALADKLTRITFHCTWIFDFLRATTAQALADKLKTTGYNVQWTHEGVTYYWSSIWHIIKACCDIIETNFGYTVDPIFSDVNYTFFTNGFRDDGYYGYTTGTFYKFNIFNVQDSTAMDNLVLDAVDNCPGLMVGSSVDANEYVGYFDENESNYAGDAYTLFSEIFNSLQLIPKFTYYSSTAIGLTISTRSGGVSQSVTDILSVDDVPFSSLAWRGVDISSSVSGNNVTQDFYGQGIDTFKKSVFLDFKNDSDFAGLLTSANSVFSLTSPPVSGNTVLRLVRNCGIGQNFVTNGGFNASTAITPWSKTAGTSGDWDWQFAVGPHYWDGVARLYNISNNGTHSLEQSIGGANTIKLFSGIWVKIVGLNASASSIVVKAYIDFYSPAGQHQGEEHTIKGTDSLNTWRLVTSNYDNRFRVGGGVRLDGSSYDEVLARDRSRRYDSINFLYTKVAIRLVVTNFVAGSAEIYVDDACVYDGFINTPDIVAGTIEKNYVSDKQTSLRKIKANGILIDIQPTDFFTHEGNDYYINRLTYNFAENETEIEAINYN